MIKIKNMLLISLLIILLPMFNSLRGSVDWFYARNKHIFCPNRNELCYCNITYNNPYTPKIHGDFLNTAILYPHYHYIYFIFNFPKNQIQKKFYLEATDISTNQTVISNGDCYLIDINKIYEYELRIYKPLYSNSTIVIKFLGLNSNFLMNVAIKFERDLSIYFNGVMLTDETSLNKSDINELIEYEKELYEKLMKQNERKSQAIEKTNKILINLFGKTLDTDIEFKETTFIEIFPVPFAIVTVTMAVGLEESTENLLPVNEGEDEQTITDIISVHGDITLESDMLENILGDNLDVDNIILTVIKIFTKKVNDLVLNIGLDTENYSLTISVSLLNKYIVLTFRFYDLDTHKNFYEIQIKIELTHKWIYDAVIATTEVFSMAIEKAAEFNKKYGKIIDQVILAMILATIIITIIILVLPVLLGSVVAAGGTGIIAIVGNAITQMALSIAFEIPFEQVYQFATNYR